jgi:HK97 family phage portal protein
MQLRTYDPISRQQSNLELRDSPVPEFGISDPLALRLISQGINPAVPVNEERVFGLPAVVECIRMPAQLFGTLRPVVYDESKGYANRVEAKDTWQHKLFRRPSVAGETTTFNFFSDICAAVDGYGNAFAQKIKDTVSGEVVELRVIPADAVRVYRNKDTGEKNFDIRLSARDVRKGLTTEDILHFRGFNFGTLLSGISVIEQYKRQMGNILGIQEFTGRYWAQNASPGGYISLPEESSDMDKEAIDEIASMWEERHGGVVNSSRPAVLKGGAKYEVPPISASSAQLIDGQRFNVEEMARMCNWPAELLMPGNSDTNKMEQLVIRMNVLYLMPRVERIKAVINEDPDLFDGPESPICLDMDYSCLASADTIEQANADMRTVQGGILTPNEVRATRGYPTHPDGDVLYPPAGSGSNTGAEQVGSHGSADGEHVG